MISGLVHSLGISVMIGTAVFAGILVGLYFLMNRKSEHNMGAEKVHIEPKRRIR